MRSEVTSKSSLEAQMPAFGSGECRSAGSAWRPESLDPILFWPKLHLLEGETCQRVRFNSSLGAEVIPVLDDSLAAQQQRPGFVQSAHQPGGFDEGRGRKTQAKSKKEIGWKQSTERASETARERERKRETDKKGKTERNKERTTVCVCVCYSKFACARAPPSLPKLLWHDNFASGRWEADSRRAFP